MNTRVLIVQYDNGHVEQVAANIIAEHIFAHVDEEDNQLVLLKEIVDHMKDGVAVHADDRMVIVNGREQLRKTTIGWKLAVVWKDGSTTWQHVKDLKESHPIEVAESAIANKIVSEPAFAWWVPFVIKRLDHFLRSVKSRMTKRTHKFGIRIPRNVKEALQIDSEECGIQRY
jgi:hypothetical protein